MTEQEAIRAFGENCKWMRNRIRDLEEQLNIRNEAQKKTDREDEEVFRLVHGPRAPVSEGCIHITMK